MPLTYDLVDDTGEAVQVLREGLRCLQNAEYVIIYIIPLPQPILAGYIQ